VAQLNLASVAIHCNRWSGATDFMPKRKRKRPSLPGSIWRLSDFTEFEGWMTQRSAPDARLEPASSKQLLCLHSLPQWSDACLSSVSDAEILLVMFAFDRRRVISAPTFGAAGASSRGKTMTFCNQILHCEVTKRRPYVKRRCQFWK
jgi:hypothetical protein